jgi:hypothetical protein
LNTVCPILNNVSLTFRAAKRRKGRSQRHRPPSTSTSTAPTSLSRCVHPLRENSLLTNYWSRVYVITEIIEWTEFPLPGSLVPAILKGVKGTPHLLHPPARHRRACQGAFMLNLDRGTSLIRTSPPHLGPP